MTTDELRTWMKALEERDVRIVALEKRLAALEAAQPPRMVVREPRHTDPELRGFVISGPQFVEPSTDDGKPLPFNPEHPVCVPQLGPPAPVSFEITENAILIEANAMAVKRGWRDIWHFAEFRSADRNGGTELGRYVGVVLVSMLEAGRKPDPGTEAMLRRRGWIQ